MTCRTGLFSGRRISQGLLLVVALAVFSAWGLSAAAEDATADAETRQTGITHHYPRVNLSTWYEVDPAWPKRSADIAWGQMPAVTVDSQDRVWVYTRAIPPVQVYDAVTGNLLFTWGREVFGDYLDTMTAHGLRIDRNGHVWLVDLGNHIVLEVSPEGKILKVLGTPGKPGCDEKHFDKPTDLVVTPEGEVFVADGYGNSRVVHFDASGRYVKEWGALGVQPGEFSLVHAIVQDSTGRLYVADRNNARIQVFNTEGKLLDVWQDLVVPWGMCMLPGDQLWVCGCSPMPWRDTDEVLSCPPKDQLFMRFDTTGKVRQLWTVPKGQDGAEQPGELNWVHGIAVDSRGNIFAGDIIGSRVQKFVRHAP
ncbi:MAG: peptidyl-alpha-hydroxyglycine alpha-amidating lyase family protein [Thermogutta sp.]